MTNRNDSVTIGRMEHTEQQPRRTRSFSNGNGPVDDGPQLEGWLIHSAHWWLWA